MLNVDNTKTINVLSLCTGYGGLELGLARALEGVYRVVAVEIEAYALANLAAKAQEGKLAVEAMWPDLKTFEAERFRGCFDFVLAGYPCQGESVAGKQLGDKDPRWLWPHIKRIIEAVEPVWCFFENVENHLNIGYPTVYASLRDMGYKIEAKLVAASDVGAPHRRKRLFILAKSSRAAGGNQNRQVDRRTRQKNVSQGNRQIGSIRIRAAGQLADAEGIRQRTAQREQNKEGESRNDGCWQMSVERSSADRWPSRPGQPQYEWEEPRVVMANTNRGRNTQSGLQRTNISTKSGVDDASKQRTESRGRNNKCVQNRSGIQRLRERNDITNSCKYTEKRQTQSGVGRAVDGTSCRVDRLRLLGNGVVPQQAEKAFRELIRLFE